MAPDPRCIQCEEVETMEHLLYGCDHYSAKVWVLLGRSMILAISQHTGDYIPNLVLTPLEIVFNEPHPSILFHIKDGTTLILLFKETKRDIIFHLTQMQKPRRQEEQHLRIQSHLVSVVNKIISLIKYQGVLQYSDSVSLLSQIVQVALNTHS